MPKTFMMRFLRLVAATLLLSAYVLPSHVQAAVVSDDFSKGTNSNDWSALGYACLTARNSNATGDRTVAGGSNIPGCSSSPEASGSGALRLTPATGFQRGAIVSNYTFPTNQGLQVTFTTYTFGGDSGGTGRLGADGMSFFLQDGAVGTKLGPVGSAVDNLGGSGGALSYSCSNGNSVYSGLTGAYLGLGMDEYGNFLNDADNTKSGILAQTASTSTNGYNSWGSVNYQSNRIGLRGAGNVSWYWLNQNYPAMYPSTFSSALQQTAVQQTCKSAFLWDYRNAVSQSVSTAVGNGTTTMSLTVPSTGGFSNGDTITIGGNITATAATKAIAGATVSGNALTFTGTGGTYSVGQTVTIAGTITVTPAGQPISSYSNYSSSAKTFRININTGGGGSTSVFAVGNSVYVSGITGTAAYPNNTAYTIAGVNTNYLTVNCPSGCTTTYPTTGSGTALLGNSSAGTPVSISGSSFTTVTGTTGSTVKVNLPTTASAVNSTSGTVALPTPTVTGSFTVANVSGTGFDVTLNYPAGSVTNTSGTVVGNGHQTTTAVQDYTAIPGGYWVLPETQPIANEAATSRSQATPITYKLMITPAGGLNFLYSYNGGAFQQVLNNWPITSANGALPASFRFGFTGATGGSTNNHDITCFLAEPVTSASGSSGNSVQSGQFKNSTQFYAASYDSYFWSGSVTAVPIALSTVTGAVTLGTATWDANCMLTGGGCATTGATSGTATLPANRQIMTWNGSQGTAFQWSSLTTAQQTILNSTDSAGQRRVAWLRGDRTTEQTASGILRARAGVLGDVVDSSPTWVGPPTINLGTSISDTLYSSAGSESSHATFNTSLATRLNMIYVGSNGGLMHGFRTGRNTSTGAYDSTVNDGTEVMAFMPSSVLSNSHVVDLTNPTYGHWYFADAAPGTGDLYYGGAWHTWLVSGMGPGGKEIFALDITDPEGSASGTTAMTEANASTIVRGDWTSATLTTLGCTNVATSANCGDNMGNTFGTPLIRRLHNGQWAIIFGNGYGSTNQHAGVFVGLVRPTASTSPVAAAGSVSFYWLDTGSGSSANPNGIAYVSSADLDGDHVADYLYAGDLLGKVWRFDLTSSNPADWAVSKFGQPGATPLFDAGPTHPITTQVATTVIAQSGQGQRVMLGFGTGQGVPFTTSSAETYASGTQSVYGVWDWDMTSWNLGRTTTSNVVVPASAVKFSALAQVTTSPYRTYAKSDLTPFTVTTTAATTGQESTRNAAISTVCWQASSVCSTGNTKYGWVMDLPATGEQLIYSPAFESGALVMNTTIPPGTGTVGQCTPVATTGWTMAVDMGSGGGFTQNAFADASGSTVVASGKTSIIGLQRNLVGRVSVLTVSSSRVVAGSTSGSGSSGTGPTDALKLNLKGGVSVKRLSWEQIR